MDLVDESPTGKRKRGTYHNYLTNNGIEIPRQTLYNQRKRAKQTNAERQQQQTTATDGATADFQTTNVANEPNNLSITAGVNESDDFQENNIEGNSINNNPIQQDDTPRDELLENYFNQIDDEEQEFYDENVLFPAANVTTAETDDEIRGKCGSSFHCQSF